MNGGTYRMLMIAVTGASNVRGAVTVMIVMQVMHDDMHRQRRSQERQEHEGE